MLMAKHCFKMCFLICAMTLLTNTPAESQKIFRIHLQVQCHDVDVKHQFETYFSSELIKLPNIEITTDDTTDLKLEIFVACIHLKGYDCYSISTVVIEPFQFDYLTGLIDICRRTQNLHELSEAQKEIIQSEVSNKDLSTIINHSVHASTAQHLRQTCQEIIKNLYENCVVVMIERRRVMRPLFRRQFLK